MPPDAEAADDSPLTIAQAVAEMDAAEERQDAAPAVAEAPPEQQDTEAEPTAEDADGPETATESDDAEPAESEEAETPDLPPIAPPPFWDADSKVRFGELPRDLQELVLAKEAERDKAISKKIEEAALKSKAAESEASRIAQLNGVLDKLLPEAVQTFKSRWENVDWNQVVDQYGAEAALKLRNDFEREQGQLQQLHVAKAQATQVEFAKFVEAETAKLSGLAPELADPKLGPKRKEELGKFLLSTGVPSTAIRNMTANETAIAYDAMRWRNAQAQAAKQAANPKPQAKPAAQSARPSVRATAAPSGSAPHQSAALRSLEGRFAADPSIKNLEALLNAKGP